MNINGVNSVQNFSVLKNNKENNSVTNPNLEMEKTDEMPKKQMVDAQTALASYKMPKVNMSFKGNQKHQEKLSDKEFEILNSSIDNYLDFNIFVKDSNFDKSQFDKNSVIPEVAQQIMKPFINGVMAESLLAEGYTFEQIEEKLKNEEEIENFSNKILSDERLFTETNFAQLYTGTVKWLDDEQKELLQTIAENNDIKNKKIFTKSIVNILFDKENAKSPMYYESYKNKMDVINKILSDDKLYTNETFMKYSPDIINNTKTYGFEEMFAYVGKVIGNIGFAKNNIETANKILNDERFYNNEDFMKSAGEVVNRSFTDEQTEKVLNLLNEGLINNQVFMLMDYPNQISLEELLKLNKTIGRENAEKLSNEETKIATQFVASYKKDNLNEIPRQARKQILNGLVSSGEYLFEISDEMKKMFPLIPKNPDEYGIVLSKCVESLDIKTPVQTVKDFNKKLNDLGDTLANMSDKGFKRLGEITQEYSRENFIKDTLNELKDLPQEEKQKVYDYFGFELEETDKTESGYTLKGYPVYLNKNDKINNITNSQTKEVIKKLEDTVKKFTKDNRIRCSYPKLENELNEIIKALPELRATIGLKQHGNGEEYGHDYDVFKHSLKVMQGIVKDPKYQELNDSDKRIMLLASLLHDITKEEGEIDENHPNMSSFDAYLIAKKFKLNQEEEIKLFTLIKNHEWLKDVNSAKDEKEQIKRQQSIAYDLRHDNLFDMVLMFTHADLKGVNDKYHDLKNEDRISKVDGEMRSYGEAADFHAEKIKEFIEELKTSQPLLPVTQIPKASEIEKSVTFDENGKAEGISGVYKDKDGLIVIKYNELENDDLEKIGFPIGSKVKGIKTQTKHGKNIDTGNIKFFAHGLDYKNQLSKFDAFSLVNSDVLLSVSYAERPESKSRFFRPQGILLDCDTKYVHGGGKKDFGSGYGKFISDFKKDYIFGGDKEKERKYISDLIKTTLNMNDEEYKAFIDKYKNCTMFEIEPEEDRKKLIEAFAKIESTTRNGNRSYNEMYISNPKPPMAVFAYSLDEKVPVDNPLDFLQRTEMTFQEKELLSEWEAPFQGVKERTQFLRQYALERDIPFVVFGD